MLTSTHFGYGLILESVFPSMLELENGKSEPERALRCWYIVV